MDSNINETPKGTTGCENTPFKLLNVKIGQTVAEIWQFIDFFSRWRPSAILDLWGANLDMPEGYFEQRRTHCKVVNDKILIGRY